MYKIVLLRHGQSLWNKENRFTGWVNVDLSEQGIVEAHAFRKTKTRDGMDYHRLDVLSIAWDKELKHLDKWNLKKACEILAIPPEPDVHAALNGAMTAYKVFKKLQMC